MALLAGTIGAMLAAGTMALIGGVGQRVRTLAVPAMEREMVPVTATTGLWGQTPNVLALAQAIRPALVTLTSGHDTWSGVIIRSDGLAVTSAHPTAGNANLTAVVSDGRHLSARVLGFDPDTGIAAIKLTGSGYEAAPLGSTSDLRAGEPVLCVSLAPLTGGGVTTSDGVIRSTVTDGTQNTLVGMILTDIQAGSETSGAALVDSNGAVIGVAEPPGSAQPMMAAPIDGATTVAAELAETGSVVHAWLGIEGTNLDAQIAKSLGIAGGALIQDVKDQSPASLAGLRGGDIITGIDDRPIVSMAALTAALRMHRPGDHVLVRVERGSTGLVMSVVLVALPGPS